MSEVNQLKRDLEIREHQLESKQKELEYKIHENEVLAAKVTAANMYIVYLLNRLGEEKINISKAQLKKTLDTQVNIKVNDDFYEIEIKHND